MRLIVPDASVLLKWVLRTGDEQDINQALNIRDAAVRGELLLKVPSLWLYEIGNTLSRRFPKQCNEALGAFLSFGLEEAVWSDVWLEQCLLLIQRYKITFYDAAYHGLALSEGGTFVTADSNYAQRTRGAGGVLALDEWT